MWKKKYVVLLLVVLLVATSATAAFAQTTPSTDTLDLDSTTILPNLFQGANIILLALGAIVFLMAGFTFGVTILKGLMRIIGNLKV